MHALHAPCDQHRSVLGAMGAVVRDEANGPIGIQVLLRVGGRCVTASVLRNRRGKPCRDAD
jgi:hypothetical protein